MISHRSTQRTQRYHYSSVLSVACGWGEYSLYISKPEQTERKTHERSRHRRQFADAAGEIVPRIVQPDAAGRPGRALHHRRAAQSAATRPRGDRGRVPRLRLSGRGAGDNVARVAAIRAGLPVTVAGATVNRFCSSGLQAIALAAHEIMHEGAEAAIGGGVESITAMRRDSANPNPWVQEHKPGIYMVMGDTAEVVAKRYKIGREAQDEYALVEPAAHGARAARRLLQGRDRADAGHPRHPRQADRRGRRKGRALSGTRRVQPPRHDARRLLALKPYFDPKSGQGTVTAGNSSQLSDGASATLLMSRERAEALGIKPLVVFRGFAVAGCEPDEMGIGPVFAVPKLLKRHGLKVDDIDLWELNEAFAVQVVYCRDRLGHRPGEAERQRRLDRHRPPVRHDRLAAGRHDRQRDAAAQGPLRRRDHVHRRRPGAAGLFEACNSKRGNMRKKLSGRHSHFDYVETLFFRSFDQLCVITDERFPTRMMITPNQSGG